MIKVVDVVIVVASRLLDIGNFRNAAWVRRANAKENPHAFLKDDSITAENFKGPSRRFQTFHICFSNESERMFAKIRPHAESLHAHIMIVWLVTGRSKDLKSEQILILSTTCGICKL